MQRVLLPLIVAVAFASGPSGFAQGVAKNGDWLLRRLKTLADEAALFDAARVENVLSLKATNIQRETIPQPAACSSPADLRSIAGTLRSPAYGSPAGSREAAPGLRLVHMRCTSIMLGAWSQSKSATCRRSCTGSSNRGRRWRACPCPITCSARSTRSPSGRQWRSVGRDCIATPL